MEETGKASELIWLKNSDTNDVVVTVYMLVDEIEPQLPKSDMHAEFVTIATIFNKKGKNNIINVKILICNLISIEASIKDPKLKVRTAKFSGNTGNIQIAVFDSLVNKIK